MSASGHAAGQHGIVKMKAYLRLCALGLALLTAIGFVTAPAQSQEPTKIRFTLDWKIQGPHSWYYVARDKGYFKAEGLDVTIDQGEGSAAAITRVMSGAYDAGFGDINAVVQNAAERPGEQPIMVYLVYNGAPNVLVVKAHWYGLTGFSPLTMRSKRFRMLSMLSGCVIT